MRRKSAWMVSCVFFLSSGIAAAAAPDDGPAGQIVKIVGDRVYVDLGAADGARVGTPLVLFETVELSVSRMARAAPRRELVPVARTFLTEVGEHVSYAAVPSAVRERVAVGDYATVVVESAGDAANRPARRDAAGSSAEEAGGPVFARPDYAADKPLVFDVFAKDGAAEVTLHYRWLGDMAYALMPLTEESKDHWAGAIPPQTHASRSLDYYLSVTGPSGAVELIGGNPAAPIRLAAPPTRVKEAPADPWAHVTPEVKARQLGFDHQPVGRAPYGMAIGFSAFVPPPLSAPRLHYRREGELAYARVEMSPEPNHHFIAEVPEADIGGVGLEYYLTVQDADGAELLAYGSPERPRQVLVTSGVFDVGAQTSRYGGNRHRLQAFAEFVGFGGEEFYAHWEADYFYRLFSPLYRLRMGLGSYNGQGYRVPEDGKVDPATQDVEGVAWYYGYSEFEWRFHKYFSVLTKMMLGINNDGIGFGIEGVMRIGDELGLNLEVGGLRAANLGTSGLFRLNIPAGEDWMFAGSVWIENLPLDEETGFRMSLDAHWFFEENWSVQARVGLAARAVDRLGPNIGLGISGHF